MRKTALRRGAVGGVLVAALVLAGCASDNNDATEETAAPSEEGSLADMEPIVLTYSESNVETAAHVIAMQGFMEEVERETDGKITFETYYSAALHPVTESLSAIQTGLTDITFVSPSNVPDLMPASLWHTVVTQGSVNSEFPMSLLEGTPFQIAAYQEGPLAEELAEYDAMTLMAWGTAPNNAICKPEILTAEQAAGKTIRTPGPPFVEEVSEMGMTSVTLPVTDVYEGLQRGVIDCFMNVVSPFITLGAWDEAKYFIPADFATSTGSQLLMKKSVVESLPLEAQRILFDARIALVPKLLEATLARNVQWANEAPDKGVIFADPTTFNEAIHTAREKYTEAALADAPARVGDAEEYMASVEDWVSQWRGLAEDLDVQSGSPTTQEGWVDLYRSVEDIDWDAYTDLLHEYLDQYRP